MRKIVVTEFLSLDGVMENPAWTAPFWNDDIAKFKSEESYATDALLLGRVTYQGFAAAWPESEDEGADRMNNLRKYVVSTTLETLEWNNSHLIQGDILEGITQLKQQDGQNLLVYGSGELSQWLLEENLVDQYNLLIYPVVVGTGKRLFKDEGHPAQLKLIDSSNSQGVAMLRYAVDRG